MHLLLVVLEFAIVLGIMVLIHELGHFIVAKLCGVRVERFSIGMPPRLFGIKVGDTDYCISALPLGGYVKMAGEYGGDGDAVHSGVQSFPATSSDLNAKPRWQRVLIALAGPFSNFILAFFFLFLVAHFHHEVDQYFDQAAVVDYVPLNTPAAHDGLAAGDTILRFKNIPHPTWEQIFTESQFNLNRSVPITFLHNGQTLTADLPIAGDGSTESPIDFLGAIGLIPREDPGPVRVSDVSADSAADRAGLKSGDQVVRIDSLELHSVNTLLAYLRDRNGAPAVLSILRNGQTLTLTAQPTIMESPGAPTQYRLGFQSVLPPVDVERLPVGAALKQSFQDNRKSSMLVLRIVQGLFTHHVSVKQMSGPVGIAQQIDLATRAGIWPLIGLMAAISLQLGILNLLPFPPLDGGMIFFLLVESLIRRDVNQRFKDAVYQVAFVCVILFTFVVLFNDITKLHLGK